MADTPRARAEGFHPFSLDALNFLLADMRGAIGPYLNVFLVTQQHWSQSSVGVVTTVAGLISIVLQTPTGALIDGTRAKRALIVAASVILGIGAVVLFALPSFWPVLIANTAMGVVGDVFAPAVAALTLGLYTRAALTRRLGRNSAWDHAGNVVIAAIAGGVGWWFSQRAVFLLVPVCVALVVIATLSIPAAAIDHARARGGDRRDGKASEAPTSVWRVLGGCRPLLIFGCCIMLFHFANAPLLPLVGQKLATAHPAWATAMMSSCIVAAQLIMLPLALLVGRTADRWGRKPLLIAAFAILPVRAALYTLSDASWWLIGVQLLDGVGAGLVGALTPLVVADLMRGTGRFNVAQGAVGTLQGIGASLSGLAAGEIVDHAGYAPAFLAFGAAAAIALGVLLRLMPDTATAGADAPAVPSSASGRPLVSAAADRDRSAGAG